MAADAEWCVKAETTIKAETSEAETTALNLEKTRCNSFSRIKEFDQSQNWSGTGQIISYFLKDLKGPADWLDSNTPTVLSTEGRVVGLCWAN